MKRILTTGLMIILIAFGVNGQTPEKRQYKVTRITTPPVINGVLDDAAWQSGKWEDSFTQNEPFSGRPATQRTEFNVLYDNDNLYVAIKAYDTAPDSIVNRLTRRDGADGDLVGIFIDSFHDLRTAFLFAVSSAGVKLDQMVTNDGQNQDNSWDPNWWVKTSINSEGWVAEMKIPFSQVRFEKNSGDIWGFNIARVLYRKNETTFWQHIPKEAPGMVHLFGELSGLEQIKPRKIFDITPYTVAKTETFQANSENPFLASGKSSKLNGGIDAKIGVTNNMTMDLTINPDFGQVEADPSQVNLTAYETFFTERRPFFIEGNNITNFALGIGDGGIGNDNLFYSRRIGRAPQYYPDMKDGWNINSPTNATILGAAKLTGKTQKGLSVGFVEAMTAQEDAKIDTIGGRKLVTVEPFTNYMIGRIQKDIKAGNTIIGGIFTSTNRNLDANLTDYLHKAAYTGGFDFTQYFKDKSWMFNLNAAFSTVQGSKKAILNTQESSARYFQRPDNNYARLDTNRTSLTGSGGRMQIAKMNGHWNFMSATLWKTPGFETNDLGYLREADQVISVLWACYNIWEPKWIYRRININADIYSAWNFGGTNTVKGFEWNFNVGLKNLWNFYVGGTINPDQLSTGMLRGGPMMKLPGSSNYRFNIGSDARKKIGINLNGNASFGLEHDSKSIYTGIDLSYKPTNFLVITLSPGLNKSFSELQYVSQVKYNTTDRYIFASIDQKTISTSFRVNLNISPNLTLQYWGQPFVATGKYYDHKFITDPMAEKYKERFFTYTSNQISLNSDDTQYNVDENADGKTDYSFGRQDFNYKQFLSNLVIRWEYNPGSTVYLVWSQTRSNFEHTGALDLLNDLGTLFSTKDNKPHNVFLIKFSYRFGLK